MSKTAIVYWSGTGNTEALANKIYESAKSLGKDVQIFTAGEFSEDKVDEFDTVIYGCP
ncbi:flavodoxin, partial [human gut metagenome]